MKKLPGLLALITLLACFTACKKMAADLPPALPATSAINVVNATADTINTFQNGTRFNITSSFYPGGSLGYVEVVAGEQQYQIKKAGTPIVLLSLPLTLDTNKAYSFFIAGNSAERAFLINDVFLANNDVEIRFVNASPDRSFDIKIADNFNFSNKAFKSATQFVKMTAGKVRYEIYKTGETTAVLSGDITLATNRVYTLFTKGTATGTGDAAFGVKLIANR